MAYVVRAYPLNKGIGKQDVRDFAHTVETRAAETSSFYQSFGVSHESWYLQDTPIGTWVIAVAIIDNPEHAGTEFARSQKPFDKWWKSEVQRLSGINPEETPLGPPVERIFHWDAPSK
jgi:hypothetical protein